MPEFSDREIALQSSEISDRLNDAGEQWVQLVPVGRIATVDNRGPYFVRDANAIVAASNKHANGRQIAVDYDHAIDRAGTSGGQAPAAGWIVELDARSDGIWGKVQWTPRAKAMIRDREYRFLSPVVLHNAQKTIGVIIRASLTNNPNFTMKALNDARKSRTMDPENLIPELREVLDLDDSAEASEILAEVKKLATSSNGVDPSKFVPIETFQQTVAELNQVNDGVSQNAAERLVDRAIEDMALLPFMRDWAVSLCCANRPAFEEFVGTVGQSFQSIIKGNDLQERFARKIEEDAGLKSSAHSAIHQTLGLSPEDVAKFGASED